MLGCLTTPWDIQGMFHDLCSINLWMWLSSSQFMKGA
jgi:hypothetical protein